MRAPLFLATAALALAASPVAAGGESRRTAPLADSTTGTRSPSVALAPASGDRFDAQSRATLRDSLAKYLRGRGFAVIDGAKHVRWRMEPKVLREDVVEGEHGIDVEVRASVVAVDAHGRVAAMVEGGARARTTTPGAGSRHLVAQALDAAARSIADDLARRLLEAS